MFVYDSAKLESDNRKLRIENETLTQKLQFVKSQLREQARQHSTHVDSLRREMDQIRKDCFTEV